MTEPTASAADTFESELRAAGAESLGVHEILRSVLAGSGDCIKILDLQGRLQFMSEGGKRVMEVENFAALKGCPWPDFWEGQGNADAVAAIAEAKAGRIATFQGAARTAKGSPRYWEVTVSPIKTRDGATQQILSISKDITAQRGAEQRQHWLFDELSHRLKNTIAMAIAIANQTIRGDSIDAAREAFSARMVALSKAQDLLIKSNWTAAPVAEIVDNTLAGLVQDPSRTTISGPDLRLQPKQALSLALALNELGTNAIKYGALSNDTGKITVTWDVTAQSTFVFSWIETGGPTVARPTRKGFGSVLIERLLADDFRGAVALDYDADGVRCVLSTARENLTAAS